MTRTDENLTGSLILSTFLHVGGMLVLLFGIPSLSTPPPPLSWKPVPIDIVEIGEITNTRLRSDTEITAKTSPPKSAPAPEKKPEEPKPPPVKPSVPEPKIEKVLVPDEVALPDPLNKPKEPPKTQEKVQKKEKEEPAPDPLASVLKNLATIKTTGTKMDDARVDQKKNEGESKEGTGKGFGPALADRLTISQEDALRRQIGSCWNMPVGARQAENLIVEVLIEVNEDRTVRSAQIIDQGKMASNPHFRSAAEAALRALRHPKCTPLALPEGQYEQWKSIRFNFDPRDML